MERTRVQASQLRKGQVIQEPGQQEPEEEQILHLDGPDPDSLLMRLQAAALTNDDSAVEKLQKTAIKCSQAKAGQNQFLPELNWFSQ